MMSQSERGAGMHADATGTKMMGGVMRKLVVLSLAIGIAATFVVLAAGCGSSGGSSSPSSSAAAQPTKGGVLAISYQDEPGTLDPALDWDDGWTVVYSLFSNFLKFKSGPGVDGTTLIPDMAQSLPQVSADGRVYTFKLKPGLKFAPPLNREVTAEDFKYSFERMMSTPLAPATYFYTGIVGTDSFMSGKAKHISGYRVVDPSTVEISLTQPDPAIVYALSLPFCAVVPQEWVDKWGKQFGRHPLGSGPFVFDSWQPGQKIAISRNPNYWNAASTWLDGVDFKYSISPSLAVMKLQKGEVDVLGDSIPSADLPRLLADPTWKDQIAREPVLEFIWTFMDVNTKPFDDPLVRQAVAWAINRDRIVKLLGGSAKTLDQVYPEGMPGHEENSNYYGYDPAKARALLAQAGQGNGFAVTLWTHNVEPFPRLAQSVQNDLRQVGIQAQVKSVNQSTYWTLMSQPGKMVMGLGDWGSDFPDPSDTIKPLFSKATAGGGSFNASGWWSPEVESLLAQADATTDSAKRLSLYTQMQQVIMKDAPVVPLYQPIKTSMYGKNVHGFYINVRSLLSPVDYWKE
jgi:oligopeptide transport system substrate-binding protein